MMYLHTAVLCVQCFLISVTCKRLRVSYPHFTPEDTKIPTFLAQGHTAKYVGTSTGLVFNAKSRVYFKYTLPFLLCLRMSVRAQVKGDS